MSTSNDVKELANEEATHKAVYLRLAKSKKNQELRDRFLKLAAFDSKHSEVGSSVSGEKHAGFSSAVVNDRPFGKNLAKMLMLGLGVAVAVYFISEALSTYFGITA